ncbi:MAG: hypothetical protein KC420_10395, partial [Myxococcales bacterium]|nr:hypothetical protein [Myxococcales bacterium]
MICGVSFPALALLAGASTAVAAPGEALPGAPWAVVTDDGQPTSLIEKVTGKRVDPEDYVEPYFLDGMVYDAESFNVDTLAAMGLTPAALPGFDFPPTPGILYISMGGVTLTPTCGNGEPANGARNCTPLVSKETTFPAYGTAQTQAAVVQKLANYYDPFHIVLTTNRPPDYLPYTMAVLGGSSGNAGYQNGVCGIANVACDGLKRNHVSLSFPSSCGGAVAEVAAQETAHNWGLEHTNVKSDLMYPYVQGGVQTFQDSCMPISHATGNGVTQCTYVHEYYCESGGGEEQNSKGELLGVFGPRADDNEKPVIVSIEPADGAVFTPDETITVTANLSDNFNMLGVRWTWFEGVPADLGETYTRCTNKVCDDDYNPWKEIDSPWDFLTLTKAPPGKYGFKLEV